MTKPFFLTAKQAKEAFKAFVQPSILDAMQHGHVNRSDLHVVVLNPNVQYTEGVDLPILFEQSIGDRPKWEKWDGKSFDDFARAKAAMSWRTGKSSREVVLTTPQLLIPGDTSLWGSAVVDGVICGISGVQPYFDEMFARMTCAAMIGEASHYSAEFAKNPDAPDFLS